MKFLKLSLLISLVWTATLCAQVDPVQNYYIPIPEANTLTALRAIVPATCGGGLSLPTFWDS